MQSSDLPTQGPSSGSHVSRQCNMHFQSAPLKIVKAQKQYMTDHIGIQYLDCVSNVSHVGHCHPQVLTAAQNQMGRLVAAQGFLNDALTKYVKQLVDTLPDSLTICFLVNSGSEANDLALRLARAHTKHHDIAVFDDAYHGNLGNLIDISPKMFKRMSQEKKEFVHVLPLPDTFRGKHRDHDGSPGQKYIQEAENILHEMESNNRNLAAFISEPIVVNCGVVIPPKNYYKDLYSIVHEMGGICIADEVQTGLGRTGEHIWAFQHFNVVPDIVTMGKSLGNGYPMGAVITTRDIAESLGEYYSTFGGNPVACVVGMAVLDVIENEKLVPSAKAVGKTLIENLHQLRLKYECIGDIRGSGLCIGIEIVQNKMNRKSDGALAEIIINKLKEDHRLLMTPQGPERNVLVLTPPMCFTQQNARSLVTALDLVLQSYGNPEGTHSSSSNGSGHVLGSSYSKLVSMDDLIELDDENMNGQSTKRQRTSYDDID